MPAGAPSCPGGFVDVDVDGDGVPDALDVDDDNDGLIEIHDLNMFAAMDNDRDGTHYNDGSTPSNLLTGAVAVRVVLVMAMNSRVLSTLPMTTAMPIPP